MPATPATRSATRTGRETAKRKSPWWNTSGGYLKRKRNSQLIASLERHCTSREHHWTQGSQGSQGSRGSRGSAGSRGSLGGAAEARTQFGVGKQRGFAEHEAAQHPVAGARLI